MPHGLRLALLCLWPVLIANPARAGEMPVDLRVMSFNIWVNGGNSLTRCIEAIQLADADIVGLQECNAATAQTIATSLGYQHLGVNDVSIVSRFPITQVLPANGGSGVTIQIGPGHFVHLFNCHLTAYPYGPYSLNDGQSQAFVIDQENTTRMPRLNSLLADMAPYLASPNPCFLVGDFNAPSHRDYADFPWPTSLASENAGMVDAYHAAHPGHATYPPAFAYEDPGVTWTPMPAQEPEGVFDRIDFVFHGNGDGLTLMSCVELDGRNSANPWPSDHRAVLAHYTAQPPEPVPQASLPFPADGSGQVSLEPLLTWLPGADSQAHRVHFGTTSPGDFVVEQTNATHAPGPLEADTTYFWRIDEVTTSGTVTGQVWSFTTRSRNAYEWNFAGGDLTPSLGDGVMTYADGAATSNLTTFGVTGAFPPDIHNETAHYMRVPAFTHPANGYHVSFTGSVPNGGGVYINQFTMIWDLLIPGPLNWTPLFNTNPENANDADFYVDAAGAVGIAAIVYSAAGVFQPDTWHRLAFAADLGTGQVSYYLDGQPIATGSAGLDGRHSLYSSIDPGPDLLLFNEGDGSGVYTHELYLSAFHVTDRTLTPEEVETLGGPDANGILATPGPLVVEIRLTDLEIRLQWRGGTPPFQVLGSVGLNPPVWEDVLGTTINTRSVILPRDPGPAFFQVVMP